MLDLTSDDLDALLVLLRNSGWHGFHRALTALLAERNALQEENIALRSRQKSHQDEVLDRVFEMDALRKRIAELEANPPAASDLRERLVCAALTGLCADPSFDGIVVRSAIELADEALVAMRKGEA